MDEKEHELKNRICKDHNQLNYSSWCSHSKSIEFDFGMEVIPFLKELSGVGIGTDNKEDVKRIGEYFIDWYAKKINSALLLKEERLSFG